MLSTLEGSTGRTAQARDDASGPAPSRPGILMLTSHDPNGESYGARLRVQNVARHLQRIGRLSMFVVHEPDHQPTAMPDPSGTFVVDRSYTLVRTPLVGLRERLAFELDPGHANTHMVGLREADRAELALALRQYDLVWVHTARIANACRMPAWPAAVLDLDDLYSQVYRSAATVADGAWRAMLDRRMAWIWRRREARLLQRFACIAVCSDHDRAYLGSPPNVQVIRNGFAAPQSRAAHRPAADGRFGFIGLLEYGPNRAGVEWFVSQVWPLVRRSMPRATLRLVGKGGDWLQKLDADGVHCLGYVDEPAGEIATWSAMVVPVRFGGGTRIKIAEAFARNCPVVSTRAGAFGYEVRSERELLLADSPQDFAEACVRLATDGALSQAIRDEAWRRFQSEWSWDATGRSVEAAVGNALAHAPTQPR